MKSKLKFPTVALLNSSGKSNLNKAYNVNMTAFIKSNDDDTGLIFFYNNLPIICFNVTGLHFDWLQGEVARQNP